MRCAHRRLVAVLALAIATLAFPAACAHAGRQNSSSNSLVYTTSDPRPSGHVRVARPTLTWRIWASDGSSAKVTKASLKLNGQSVPVIYDAARRSLVHEPTQPLEKGVVYIAKAQVIFSREFAVNREWQFTIAPDALDALPSTLNAYQTNALAAANEIRRSLGLPPFRPDAALSAAAQAHSGYVTRNRRGGHFQQENLPGFVGATPGDRIAAFGYAGGEIAENVGVGSLSVSSAVTGLFDAPYHRLPFLHPGAALLGVGYAAGEGRSYPPCLTMEFGMPDTHAEATIVYPREGQTNVPTSWDGNENPNPLRFYSSARRGARVGYVISFSYFAGRDPDRSRRSNDEDRKAIIVRAATLMRDADDTPVPVYVNTPSSDEELDNTALLIPRTPLAPGTTYRVTVEAVSAAGGRDISRTWRFTTSGVRR